MSYSPKLSSAFNDTKNRSEYISHLSGLCSLCTEECAGTCEVALASVLGSQAVYPTTTGNNQVASEKNYPIDFSHFNINGRVFGAQGTNPTYEEANIFSVKTNTTFGRNNPIKMAMPIILPALIKLNWEDYYAGAAMAGVCCVIGEDAKSRDSELKHENGKVVHFPLLAKMLDSFRKYYRGYGQVILQINVEDDMQGVAEYAVKEHNVEAIEFKFGQSAKGTQPALRLRNMEEALKKKEAGMLVNPDPTNPEIVKAYEEGVCPNFYAYGRLPLWEEEYILRRIGELRELGVKNFYFKMAGYDSRDLERLIRLGSAAEVDMITFDGAGGGSGYSPCKMMNEWGLPAILMERELFKISEKLKAENLILPALTITGGFSSEDQVFKALAYGDGHIKAVGLCRASMTAAMMGKNIGRSIMEGKIPNNLKKYGSTVEEIFGDLPDLRALYGLEANNFSLGAVGVFSYLNKINFGIKHFAALNRKFDTMLLNREDLIPLTAESRELLNK